MNLKLRLDSSCFFARIESKCRNLVFHRPKKKYYHISSCWLNMTCFTKVAIFWRNVSNALLSLLKEFLILIFSFSSDLTQTDLLNVVQKIERYFFSKQTLLQHILFDWILKVSVERSRTRQNYLNLTSLVQTSVSC